MLTTHQRGKRGPTAIVLVALLSLSSCVAMHDRRTIREGLLTLELPQTSFLDVWGKSTRTLAMTGDQVIKAGISGWGGFYFKGGEMYEMWQYDSNQTNLIFHDQKLVAWQTEKTVKELTAPSRFSSNK